MLPLQSKRRSAPEPKRAVLRSLETDTSTTAMDDQQRNETDIRRQTAGRGDVQSSASRPPARLSLAAIEQTQEWLKEFSDERTQRRIQALLSAGGPGNQAIKSRVPHQTRLTDLPGLALKPPTQSPSFSGEVAAKLYHAACSKLDPTGRSSVGCKERRASLRQEILEQQSRGVYSSPEAEELRNFLPGGPWDDLVPEAPKVPWLNTPHPRPLKNLSVEDTITRMVMSYTHAISHYYTVTLWNSTPSMRITVDEVLTRTARRRHLVQAAQLIDQKNLSCERWAFFIVQKFCLEKGHPVSNVPSITTVFSLNSIQKNYGWAKNEPSVTPFFDDATRTLPVERGQALLCRYRLMLRELYYSDTLQTDEGVKKTVDKYFSVPYDNEVLWIQQETIEKIEQTLVDLKELRWIWDQPYIREVYT